MTGSAHGPLQALILAGGRSRRLGGVPKAGLMIDGQTLLARTLDAAAAVLGSHPNSAAGQPAPASADPATAAGNGSVQPRIAVVGPGEKIALWLETAHFAEAATVVQEDPPFSGPAAGIAAGLQALTGQDGRVLVLACDMPHAGEVAALLADGLARWDVNEGVMAVAEGRKQPLAAIYPLRALRAAVEAAREAQRLENASVFSIIASVNMKECAVPSAMTADIDTWADARAQGIAAVPADAEG